MSADWAFFLVALPFLFIAAYTDLRYMLIKNWMNLAMAVAFLIPALIYLPFSEIGFRIGIAFVVLVVLILLAAFDAFGGGDAKYLAALALYIPPTDYMAFIFILSFTNLLALVIHRVARRQRCVRAIAPRWKSWRVRKFPMGYAISGAALLFLGLRAVNGPVLLG